MKVPQSDMPEEALWQSFFNPESLLETLLPKVPVHGDAVELGAGYGTFTRAALNFVKGTLHAYEIETELCNDLKELVSESYPERLQVHCRDVLANGTGLSANSVELVMIFNLLHFGCPSVLLLANLCEVAPECIQELDLADYEQVQKAYQDFLE